MLPYRDSRVVTVVLTLFFVIVLIYAYYEARTIIVGPVITIPTEVTEVHDSPIVLEGVATHIASLTIDGHVVSVTETGSFKEPYLPQIGYNKVTFEAKDKYGTVRAKVLEIVYTPSDTHSTSETSDTLGITTGATSTP